MSLANQTFPTRKQAEQLIADACIGGSYEPREIDGRWHVMPILTCDVTPPKDSPLEQLAQRFEIYADDNEALLSRGYMYKTAERVKIGHRIATWRDVAKELREIETQLLGQDRVLLLCSAATRLPVAE